MKCIDSLFIQYVICRLSLPPKYPHKHTHTRTQQKWHYESIFIIFQFNESFIIDNRWRGYLLTILTLFEE